MMIKIAPSAPPSTIKCDLALSGTPSAVLTGSANLQISELVAHRNRAKVTIITAPKLLILVIWHHFLPWLFPKEVTLTTFGLRDEVLVEIPALSRPQQGGGGASCCPQSNLMTWPSPQQETLSEGLNHSILQ